MALCIYTTCTAPPVCGMESVGRGGEFGMEEGSGQGRKRKGEERRKGRGLAGRRRRYGK